MQPLALVIENDGGTRRLLDVLLTRSGLEVDLVSTGAETFVLLENVRYDLLIIDLLLDDAHGTQVLEWIASHHPEDLRRSIVLSSAPEWQLNRVREQWPAVRVIRKPFELAEIFERARQAVVMARERMPSFVADFCRSSVRAGARSGLIAGITGGHLELLHAFGYRPDVIASYFPIALDAPMPICAAIRNRTPVWIASIATAKAQYPLVAAALDRHGSRALAAIPLLRDGHVAGVVGWSFREPHVFGEAEQNALATIAAALADGLPNASGQSMTAAGA